MNAKKFNRIVKSPCRWSEIWLDITNTVNTPDNRTINLIKAILEFEGEIILEPKEECPSDGSAMDMIKSIVITYVGQHKFIEFIPQIESIITNINSSTKLIDLAQKTKENLSIS